MGLFDGYQDTAFDNVTSVMGQDATWTPSTGGPQQLASVLLNSPTEQRNIDHEAMFDPTRFTMEYRIGFFTGLKELVDSDTTERVTILSVDYYVRSFVAKYDGKTLVAVLQPVNA